MAGYMPYQEFLKRLFTTALLIVLLIGIWNLRSILMLGFLSVLIAVAIHIPADRLERRGWRHGTAAALMAVGFGALSVLLSIWIIPSVIVESAALIAKAPDAVRQGAAIYESWRTTNGMLQLILPPLIDERFGQAQAVLGITQNSLAAFAVNVLDSTLPLLQGLGNILLTFLANLLLVVFVSILLLIEPQTYRRIGLMLVPRPHHARFRQIWNEIHRTLTRWIVAQSISVAITIALVWFILGVLLSMPNALIVALFAGFATFIPNIGAFLPLIPIVVFTIADDPARLLVVAPVYLAIQFVESNILTPSIVDAELHIPIGGLLFFQVIAASLFGALGLLLAAPLLAVLATIVRETYSYDVLGLRNVDLDAALTAAASDSGEDEEHPVLLSEPAAQGS